MTSQPEALSPDDIKAIDAAASVLMKRGIRLVTDAAPSDAIHEALGCFERALDMRSRLPVDRDPVLRYGLAACWLNRADALRRLGRPDQLATALHSYEQGIALLRDLPMADDPRFPRRLVIAYQNRGQILQTRGAASLSAAIAAFAEAMAVLEHPDSAAIPDRAYLLAGVWMNVANARIAEDTDSSWMAAAAAALRALALVTDLEAGDADAAEVGLKARHVLCHTIARRLSQGTTEQAVNADVHQATDIVDEGLELVRRWERQGVARFRGTAYDLFRFGARVYATYPGYVNSPEMHAAALEARMLLTDAQESTGE